MLVVAVALIAVAIGGILYVSGQHEGPESETITVQDMLGVEVEVKKNPKNVACVSRTTYDLLIAFGLGDYVDGVYSTILDNEWTSVLYSKSSEHYAYPYEPSYETLLERKVELVFCPEVYIAEGLREHGIAALCVSLYGNPEFEPYVFYLSNLTKQLWPDVKGVKENAEAWEEGFQSLVDDIKSKLPKQGSEQRTIYYIRGDKNNGVCYTDTGKSFNEYVFKVLGCKYLGAQLGTTRPSVEALLDADPDVIVIGGIFQYTLREALESGSVWTNLSALKSGSIYQIGVGFTPMEQLGVFSSIYLASMANYLYPEFFDYDTKNMLISLCKQYFDIDLTEQQAEYMLNGLGPDGNRLA